MQKSLQYVFLTWQLFQEEVYECSSKIHPQVSLAKCVFLLPQSQS